MSNFKRKLERTKEKKEIINLKNTYGKKIKEKCPKCKKKSLFMTNKNGETYCIRCDERVK